MLPYKIKGGFISDVIGVTLVTAEKGVLHSILKLESQNESFLSKMAIKLGLYDREYYFYETIRKHVPIKYPEYYGLVYDESFHPVGILMKNLSLENYSLNLDLNAHKIEQSFKIIERLAQLHASFWNKPNFDQLDFHVDWVPFIQERWPLFKKRWTNFLTQEQLVQAETIANRFQEIQTAMHQGALTICHGDVKSANLFYKPIQDELYEPYFIDWQYLHRGKGVEDLVFFMIKSFNVETMGQIQIDF